MVKVQIVNVVATASLNQDINFEGLSRIKEVVYNPGSYGTKVAYFKISQMTGRVSIFSSGKMISVGTKSEEQAIKELQLCQRFIAEKGLAQEVMLEPTIQNIVATVAFEHSINLEDLSQATRAIYEPEQFPGAILRLMEPFKTSILVFASGKVVITGLKDTKHIQTVVDKLTEIFGNLPKD